MVIPSGPLAAMAILKGEGELRGTVKFYRVPCATLVAAEVTGLPGSESGFYGLHIHEGKECTGKDYSDSLGHFDTSGQMHPRHSGDLPPLLDAGGRGFLAVETDRFLVEEVVGHTVVLHEAADDFTSQPAGNAGRKIACGVVKWI